MAAPFAMPGIEVSKNNVQKKAQLKLKKLNVVEISSGRLYIFQYHAIHRLKTIRSKESFIGVKKGTSRIVDLYVDSNKLPLTIASQLKAVDSSMPLEERINIGKSVSSHIFRFEEDKDSLYIHFNNGPIEVGVAN